MPRRKRRSPTQNEQRFVRGQFELDELFYDFELDDIQALARLRVINVFRHATEHIPRRPTGQEYAYLKAVGLNRPYWREVRTDNYILGVSKKQKDLAGHVHGLIRRHFVKATDPPLEWIREIPDYLAEEVLGKIERKVVLSIVNAMCSTGEIWYDESRGIWQMSQGTIDEYVAQRDAARRGVKYDDRSYHGRPRNQTKRRGIPEGTSIGGAIAG